MTLVASQRSGRRLNWAAMALLLAPLLAGTGTAAPAIVCENPEHYFGAVSNTATVVCDFTIANEGNSPLFIPGVRPDCGCLIARMSDVSLDPGESATLRAEFNLKNRAGPQLRRIVVESNDPAQPRLVLVIAGEAIAPVRVEPERIYWGNAPAAADSERACEIFFQKGDESYINAARADAPFFSARTIVIKPRRHYRVEVRASAPLPEGPFETILRVETDNPRFRTLEIPMQGRFVGRFYTVPPEISCDTAGDPPARRVLLVYSAAGEPFKVVEARAPDPAIQVSTRRLAAGRGWRIDLSGIPPEAGGKALVIRTDCDGAAVLEVPFQPAKALR